MIVKLLTEHHLEFLSLTGGYTGLSESTHVKMPHCWKSHALAQIIKIFGSHNFFNGYVLMQQTHLSSYTYIFLRVK